MESDISRTSILLKLNIQRRRMSREHQTRRILLRTIRISRRTNRPINRKLRADFRTTAPERARFPDSKTGRVAVIGFILRAGRVVDETMVVQFFSWVVGVYVFPTFLDIVCGVLDGPDPAGCRVLAPAYAVPQTPAQDVAALREDDRCGEQGGDVEDPRLGPPAVDPGRGRVDVA